MTETLDELAIEKDLEVQDVVLSKREIKKIQIEKVAKQAEQTALQTKIDKLITDELATRRTALATYKITDGFEDKSNETNGKDNRRAFTELKTIKTSLEDIRYLENADEAHSSSVDDENTAYTALDTLIKEYQTSKVFEFIIIEGTSDSEKCKKIKETTKDLDKYDEAYTE